MADYTIFNCISEGDDIGEMISPRQIKNIIPIVAKDGKPALLINYYDDEFCINSSIFCDKIEAI
jgi:hypothetical protein